MGRGRAGAHAGAMARPFGFDRPGMPQHVVQRGRNGMPCFFDIEDRVAYLDLLRQACDRHGCAVHAYVLMDHHVHLLLTPSTGGAVSRVMQMLGRGGIAQCFESQPRRRFSWERLYAACVVDSDASLLACMRYIERNPVRAWVTCEPDAYRWSSHGANAFGDEDAVLTPHPAYLQLCSSPPTRRATYRALFEAASPDTGGARVGVDWDRRSVRPAAGSPPDSQWSRRGRGRVIAAHSGADGSPTSPLDQRATSSAARLACRRASRG